jgi:hypothetical protein
MIFININININCQLLMLTKPNRHEKKYLSCLFIETELFYNMQT